MSAARGRRAAAPRPADPGAVLPEDVATEPPRLAETDEPWVDGDDEEDDEALAVAVADDDEEADFLPPPPAPARPLLPPGPQTWRVAPADAGERLDKWLVAQCPALSRSALQRLIEEGRVTLDGAPVVARRKVAAGEEYLLVQPPPADAAPSPEPIPLRVVLEDEHLLVVDKDAGLVVHPSAGHPHGTLVNALLHHCGEGLSGINGVRRPGILHRLDQGTSGLLLVAKSDAAHRALADDLRARRIDRHYVALVQGEPRDEETTIVTHLGRDPRNRLRRAVVRADAPDARRAETSWRLERRFHGAALLDIKLATGRTHQIRVHLAHVGHPVVGDVLYGYQIGGVLVRQAPHVVAPLRAALQQIHRPFLHARRLAFTHPVTGLRVECEAPLPDDLATLLAALDRLAR